MLHIGHLREGIVGDMMTKLHTICIIPARAGSKRLPGKNSMLFNGKSLITRKVEQALRLHCFNAVVVSTDDTVCMEMALNAGAMVLPRPDHLATDTASTEAVVEHVLDTLSDDDFTHVIVLQVTSPCVQDDDLHIAYGSLMGISPNVIATDEQGQPNGAFYGIKTELFRLHQSLDTIERTSYHMPNRRSIDIDTIEDFQRAELIAAEMELLR